MLCPSYVSRYCPLYALEHLWILPSSVPTKKRCSLWRLKSKQQPPANPDKEVSSGSSFICKTNAKSSAFGERGECVIPMHERWVGERERII